MIIETLHSGKKIGHYQLNLLNLSKQIKTLKHVKKISQKNKSKNRSKNRSKTRYFQLFQTCFLYLKFQLYLYNS